MTPTRLTRRDGQPPPLSGAREALRMARLTLKHVVLRRPFTVMVVDDSEMDLELITHHLTTAGYVVTTCLTAESAIRQLIDRKPDVIVMDIKMPTWSGDQLTALIRMTGCRMPIVAYSAVAPYYFRDPAAWGFDRYVEKTPEAEDLLVALHDCLHHRRRL